VVPAQRITSVSSDATSTNVLDHIPYMSWTYDAGGALEYVNTAWTLQTGQSIEDGLTRDTMWNDLLAPNESASFIQSLASAIANNLTFRREARFRKGRETSQYHWHIVNVEPALAPDGNATEWTGIAVDIDELKRADDALLERERQYQQELARSTLFQQALLPPNLPSVPGLSFDVVYEPGLSNETVGGDWYDAFRLLDGRILLTIGDVAGSGIHAAVIMGVVRQIMRGIAQLYAEPALMLDAADRALRLEYPEVLVTAWVGILDLVGRTVTFASAGHPPPLLLNADGGVRELDHLTLPIGLRQGHQGHASTVEIGRGSTIWLYTDGLIEVTRNIVDGCALLEETARSLSTQKVEHPAALIRHLMLPNGSPDDVAILVVTTDFEESEKCLTRSQFDSRDAEAARSARRTFAASLGTSEFSEIDIANAEIVFGELCGNVARYAPGIIDVVVDRTGLQTVLHIFDRGCGFRHVSRLPADPLSEHGRGLFIIAAMTTEFTVSLRRDGGSHARAVLVGRYPVSLLLDETLPAVTDQISSSF